MVHVQLPSGVCIFRGAIILMRVFNLTVRLYVYIKMFDLKLPLLFLGFIQFYKHSSRPHKNCAILLAIPTLFPIVHGLKQKQLCNQLMIMSYSNELYMLYPLTR